MNIRKAVITAAGRGVRLYPAADSVQKAMLPFMDRDGVNKPVLQVIAEEALDSGIEEICVVCAPGDEARYRDGFDLLRRNLLEAYRGVEWAMAQAERITNLLGRLHFAVQAEPLGYGDAVRRAKSFVAGEPFLLLLGDHLYISALPDKRCAQQLLELAATEECPISAVHSTREHLIGAYGTVAGRRIGNATGVYQIDRIIEKPSVSRAETELHVPGLRAGHYLCFFGMHVLTAQVLDFIEEEILPEARRGGQAQLTPALQTLAQRGKYLALEVQGTRHDLGTRYGLLQTQLSLGLSGRDRDEVLTAIFTVLAETTRRPGGTPRP